jgi:integrase
MASVTVNYRKYEAQGQTRWEYTFYIPKKYSTKENKEGERIPQKVKKSGFRTRKVAQEHFKANYGWLERDRPDEKPIDEHYTFDQLVADYEAEYSGQAAWEKSKRFIVQKLKRDFGNVPLSSITLHSIKEYKNQLKTIPNRFGNTLAAATVNRYLACLRHMLAVAVDNRKLARNPFLDTQEQKGGTKKKSLMDRANVRERCLSAEEIERFLAVCDKEGDVYSHVKDFFMIAVHTGMDKGEILNLTWDQIDFEGKTIYCPEVKTRPPAHIPMSDELADYLKEIRHRKVTKYVVVDSDGKQVHDFRTAFLAVCRKAKIYDFRVKDLMHTFATHFAMRTGDLATLQYILRHTTPRMTARYVHLCQKHKAAQVQKMNGLTSKSRTNVELPANFPTKKGDNKNH